jgi:WD40 repeat protein
VISIGSLGVQQILAYEPTSILVGCGNGVLGKYVFDSKTWNLNAKVVLKNKVTSLSANKNEFLVATNMTQVLVLRKDKLEPYLLQESHNQKINFIKFKDGDNNVFGTSSEDGHIRIWDMASRSVVCKLRLTAARIENKDLSIPKCFQIREEMIISGWSNGMMQMHDAKSCNKIWQIDNCHKEGILTVELSKNSRSICTGGADG